jgi:L-ascorbate metabolism protein UlaG (beta-lactamase superfamily)
MRVQLIRNATLKLSYAEKTILVDPMLCSKETFEPFVKGLERNPQVDLNIPINEIISNLDSVLVTHSHPDHFDPFSGEKLPKEMKLFSTPVDQSFFLKQEFSNVEIIDTKTTWENITITRIEGKHGSGPVLPYMGQVSGYILQSENEPTIYIVSDSILNDEVKKAIVDYKPEIIVINAGGGIIPGFEDYPVLMDEKQTVELTKFAPKSKVIAVHLDCIDFCKTTRKSLRKFASEKGVLNNQLLIPKDGEILTF